MIKNYFHISFRSLYKNRLTSLINIVGLGLAIGCCIPFYHIIRYETSFDHFHERADRIYRVILDWSQRNDSGHVHYPAADALQTDFADFELITRAHGPVSGKISIEHENGQKDFFIERQILYADQFFLKTFNFRSLTSISPNALKESNKVLLTATLARKYFSDAEPIGKTIWLNGDTELQIAGILADPPGNTNLPFSMIISYATFDLKNKERDGWLFAGDVTVYVTLKEGEHPEKFRNRLEDFTRRHVAFYKKGMYSYNLQSIKEMHTSTGYGYDTKYYTPPELIWMPAFLGLLIIIIACINFANLSTAQLLVLAKETNIRKVIGSSRIQLLLRFLIQPSIIIVMALILGLLLGHVLLQEVNQLFAIVDYHLAFDFSTLLFISFLGLLILLLAGFYPALFLANLKPTNIFQGSVHSTGNRLFSYLGKALVVFQIGSSLLLLVAAIVITVQINSWKNTDWKFRTADIITVPVPDTTIGQRESFRHLLQSEAGVKQITFSNGSPLGGRIGAVRIVGTPTYQDSKIHFIDNAYPEVFDLKFITAPTKIDPNHPSVLVNQKMASLLGFSKPEDAVGDKLEVDVLMAEHVTATIGGVIEDYINNNPTNATISPCVLLFYPEKTNEVNVALASHSSSDILGSIQNIFKKVYPNEIFIYKVMTDEIEETYIVESLMQKTIRFMASISILISCIGIVGVINFMAMRRRKEFSVRKVVGANRSDIVKLIMKEYIFLILLGFLIGAPIATWLLQRWLQDYPQHIALRIEYFVAALCVIIAILVTIILIQVQKISREYPAKVLKEG